MTTKEVDAKGRIAIGKKFAGKTVIVEEIDDTEIRIIAAKVIPQREFWLHKNKKAMASVQRGLAQAKAGKISKVNPHEDDPWLEQLND
ncbi:MAG TPA: hypothetical protein VGZ26_08655 [Pirellulales bacterium]|jgi:hypothetical protein|nr:hypothetical protein [Pirellulales bacterium]